MNPSEAKDGPVVIFLSPSLYQSPHLELIIAGNNLVVGFGQFSDANLLVSPELYEDLEERLDAVGTIGEDGVVAVAESGVVEATVVSDKQQH